MVREAEAGEAVRAWRASRDPGNGISVQTDLQAQAGRTRIVRPPASAPVARAARIRRGWARWALPSVFSPSPHSPSRCSRPGRSGATVDRDADTGVITILDDVGVADDITVERTPGFDRVTGGWSDEPQRKLHRDRCRRGPVPARLELRGRPRRRQRHLQLHHGRRSDQRRRRERQRRRSRPAPAPTSSPAGPTTTR